jgi:hypothetical protein
MGAGRALQVHHGALIGQQVLPMRGAVTDTLTIGALTTVLAAWALQPCATGPVGGGINR